MKRRRTLKPWLFGVIAGGLFVSVEALAGVYPPSAYGFCLTCHVRDLAGTVINALFGTNMQTAVVARRMLMVTSPAVLLGAWVAARRSGERRILPSGRPLAFLAVGFAVMTTGLVIFGCPTRIVLRAGYGEFYGLAALAGLAAGVAAATFLVRWAGRAGLTLPFLRAARFPLPRGRSAGPETPRPATPALTGAGGHDAPGGPVARSLPLHRPPGTPREGAR
jgi:hypothetical protein